MVRRIGKAGHGRVLFGEPELRKPVYPELLMQGAGADIADPIVTKGWIVLSGGRF